MKNFSNFEPVRLDKEAENVNKMAPPTGQTKIEVVPLSKFQGKLQQAIQFYSGQVSKLTYENSLLCKQLRSSLQEKKQLADIVAAFKQQEKSSPEDNKKRVRRCANEIKRSYVCPIAGCEKSYGAEGSMAQHMKYKHPNYKPSEKGEESIVKKEKSQEGIQKTRK